MKCLVSKPSLENEILEGVHIRRLQHLFETFKAIAAQQAKLPVYEVYHYLLNSKNFLRFFWNMNRITVLSVCFTADKKQASAKVNSF